MRRRECERGSTEPALLHGQSASCTRRLHIWPVSKLSASQPHNHIEWANNKSADVRMSRVVVYRSVRYIDCRHFCFPGSVLEARNEQLFSMLDAGCV